MEYTDTQLSLLDSKIEELYNIIASISNLTCSLKLDKEDDEEPLIVSRIKSLVSRYSEAKQELERLDFIAGISQNSIDVIKRHNLIRDFMQLIVAAQQRDNEEKERREAQ